MCVILDILCGINAYMENNNCADDIISVKCSVFVNGLQQIMKMKAKYFILKNADSCRKKIIMDTKLIK